MTSNLIRIDRLKIEQAEQKLLQDQWVDLKAIWIEIKIPLKMGRLTIMNQFNSLKIKMEKEALELYRIRLDLNKLLVAIHLRIKTNLCWNQQVNLDKF